ncbi:MAG: heparinase II/III family protein [Pseudomonadota bacterium]|nr:heparinase II/III family protein [Pseudomonadota bacterium]
MIRLRESLVSIRHNLQNVAFSVPLYSLTLGGNAPLQLLAAPGDPWPGNTQTAQNILAGRYAFAGQTFSGTPVPWLPAMASMDWLEGMHGFGWLRDLRSLGGDAARRVARALVSDWLDQFGTSWNSLVWSPHIMGQRIASWLALYDFFWASADDVLRSRIFDSAARQIRHLARVFPGQASGLPVFQAVLGLVCGSIYLTGNGRHLSTAMKILGRELVNQTMPDGGHVDRCPSTLLQVLRCLVDIRSALRAGRVQVPEILQHSIDRMAPALRFFRHGDGGLALFNGGQEENSLLVEMLLTQADARGKPLKSAPHVGFERLLSGRTLVLIDTGRPQTGPDSMAYAGTLSFEMSVGRERMIVNCGAHPDRTGSWRRALASTAAHSTVTVADTNSAEILDRGGLGRIPEVVRCTRMDTDGASLVEASHDGYLPVLGLVHHRRFYLADGGDDLRGEDTLDGPGGHSFAVRFHLHPSVQVSLTHTGNTALLKLAGGQGWRFRASGCSAMAIEEGLYLGGDEPRRTSQLVLTGVTGEDRKATVKWAFQREKQKD